MCTPCIYTLKVRKQRSRLHFFFFNCRVYRASGYQNPDFHLFTHRVGLSLGQLTVLTVQTLGQPISEIISFVHVLYL